MAPVQAAAVTGPVDPVHPAVPPLGMSSRSRHTAIKILLGKEPPDFFRPSQVGHGIGDGVVVLQRLRRAFEATMITAIPTTTARNKKTATPRQTHCDSQIVFAKSCGEAASFIGMAHRHGNKNTPSKGRQRRGFSQWSPTTGDTFSVARGEGRINEMA